MARENLNKYSSKKMKKYFSNGRYRNSIVKKKSIFKKFWYIVVALLILIGTLSISYYRYIINGLPSLEQLENPKPELATKVYSYDGEVLDQFYLKNRTKIRYDKIPQSVIDALISTEDKDFYKHWGVTPWRFIQAMIKNILSFRLKEGASTITQQLARNLYNLKIENESSFDKITRKIREYITSVQIERTFTKKEILEMYLNVIYLGRGAYGISAAASIYFNKAVNELTLAEGSLLIGMAKNPLGYDPVRYPHRAFARRDVVLSQMVKYQRLTVQQMEATKKEELHFKTNDAEGTNGIAPHFTEYIRQQLLQKAEKYGFDIFKDGLSIYTTLDSKMQRFANQAVEEHLQELQMNFNKQWDWSKNLPILERAIEKNIRDSPLYKKAGNRHQQDSISQLLRTNKAFIDSVKKIAQTIEVGFIVIDPHTGGIRAMVGGSNFRSFKYGLNHTTQIRRQPGSSFKPFVFTVAIDNGYPPCYEILNQPVTLMMPDGTRWTPSNFDGTIGGKYTIREGVQESINLVAVRAIMEIAPKEQVVQYAKRMGINSPLSPYESIALGTSLVSPLEMSSAFGVFANEGVYVQPTGILKIEDKDGNLIEDTVPEKKEVLSKETAYIMTSILQDVVNKGTGGRVRNFFHYHAAGKTGTTQDYADAWFVGYTPQLTAAVWLGFDDQQIKFSPSDGQGGKTAAPLWGKFMHYVYSDKTIPLQFQYFQQPDGVVQDSICSETKKLSTQFCPKKDMEIFNIKYLPSKCDKHTSTFIKEEENPNQF